MKRWLVILLAMLCIASEPAFSETPASADLVAVPALQHRVTDLTNTLTAEQQATLEQTLAAFEQKKGSQIAVLIVPTTQPEEIEQYSIRVTDQWKLGRKGVDDGVLLLVAKDDHAVRIEVGYGLEGAIPDAGAKRIVEDDIIPRFRDGDFYGGISAGVDRLMRVIDGEPLPAPKAKSNQQFNPESLLVIGFFLVFVIGGILRAIFGRVLGAGIVGGIAAVITWALIGTLIATVGAGILVFIFALLFLGNSNGIGYPGGGFGGGGFGGGGGWSGGGGGGFGGGGASGRW